MDKKEKLVDEVAFIRGKIEALSDLVSDRTIKQILKGILNDYTATTQEIFNSCLYFVEDTPVEVQEKTADY